MYIPHEIWELNWVKFQQWRYRRIESAVYKDLEGEAFWEYKNWNKGRILKIPFKIWDTCNFYYEDWIPKCDATLLSIDEDKNEKSWKWKLYYPTWELWLEFESVCWPICYQQWYFCDDFWWFEWLFFWIINIEKRDSSYIATEWWDDCWFEDKDYDDNAEYMWRYDEDNGFYIRDVFYTWLYNWKFTEYYKWWQIKSEYIYKDWKREWDYIEYNENWEIKNKWTYLNSVIQ